MSGPIRAVCSMLAPAGRPLGRILEDRAMYSHYPMSKEELVHYYNTVWPTYLLDYGGKWPLNGSLNYCTIMQLELYCQ